MRVTHDPVADAVFVYFVPIARGAVKRTRHLDGTHGDRHISLDAGGRMLGLELLNVSHGIDLRGAPRAAEVAEALTDAGIRVTHRPPATAAHRA